MSDDSQRDPGDELRDMLRELLSGNAEIDPRRLAGAAGLPDDPALIAQMISQLQGAIQQGGDGVNWSIALDQAKAISASTSATVTPADREATQQVLGVAALWLGEVTSIAELTSEPHLLTREQWVEATMPVWTQLAEPVATSIADALTDVIRDQAPEELAGMLANAGQLMRNIGGTLFAMQLGHVVGQLSTEVVSGGDIGIPLLTSGDSSDHQAAVLPQNIAAFGEGLDIPADQVQLYLAVRELAHARLFRHAKWLRLQLISAITDYARGIHIDTEPLQDLAADLDPSNPEQLREALASGALIPPKTDAQLAALGRLETILALIEGWVDTVTARATTRLPSSTAIAEMVRRRRAAGGPAESAFATLVGLELRPRRLREAAAMWQKVTDAVGAEERDALWAHPDVVPTSEDIDRPEALIERLTRAEPELDDIDRAIEDLLGDEDGDRPRED
ncbi:zinc-dependent metalloprotease [Salinibacterium sp. SYSU T00001]|uniref:zinc-dependent metalloprotease n=1 Tax=Homoserinimonas sedimenticola TaxID=2986805 RepID=UPI0022361405|nr:zinc-dependent metalloprotease [Salinibacterium sedimenticola]MCW4386527.1 zinc-dependent metalloprotease [Salinibacterium sedimenticola]